VDGDVLIALAGTVRPLTGRDIVRLTSRSPNAVQTTLDRLVGHGLVARQEAGRAFLHTLNRDHVAAPAVDLLAGLGRALRERISALVAGWLLDPEHLSMFGSGARADGDTDSDIDLFLVRPDGVDTEDPAWRDQVADLEAKVPAWTGNRAEVHELSEGALPEFVQSAPPILRELRDDAVDLYGTRLYELLKQAEGR
jgi:hypothetical protein